MFTYVKVTVSLIVLPMTCSCGCNRVSIMFAFARNLPWLLQFKFWMERLFALVARFLCLSARLNLSSKITVIGFL